MTLGLARRGADTAAAVANLIAFLETGHAPDGTFAPEAFCDVTLPRWRAQTTSADEIVAARRQFHPCPGTVHVERMERTEHGFTLEFVERWQDQGEEWMSREMIRADVTDGTITEMSVYCTGDWDTARRREHAASVTLVRP